LILEDIISVAIVLDEAETSNMAPPLPPETPPSKPPIPDSTPPPTPDENSRHSFLSRESSSAPSEGRSESPSLEELEEKYKLLQKSLFEGAEDSLTGDDVLVVDSVTGDETGDLSVNPIQLDSDEDNDAEADPEAGTSTCPIEIGNDSIDSTSDFEFVKPKLVRCGSTTSIQTFGELGSGSPRSSAPGTPVHSPFVDVKPEFKGTVSKSRDFSTPIMKRTGSIESLPSDAKFSMGIEDHIPFENLPGATGNFEKMRQLVSKIRDLKGKLFKK